MSRQTAQPDRRAWLRRVRRVLGPVLLVVVVLVLCRLTGCMERMFFYPVAEPTPVPAELPGAEKVTFQSADGTTLVGWFVPAMEADDPSNAPTILHAHGNAGNLNSHWWFTAYLPEHGFNVLLFDYRGYGESAGRATRRAPLIADTEAALDYLLTRDDVDVNRIGLYGQSLGGAIGIEVMKHRPEIRAAVFESPFASWRRIAANAVGGDPPHRPARALATLLISDDASPINAMAQIDRPVLILHGDADSIIPVSHARSFAALKKTNITVVELPGGDHNTLRSTHPEVEQIVSDFLRTALSGETTSPEVSRDGD